MSTMFSKLNEKMILMCILMKKIKNKEKTYDLDLLKKAALVNMINVDDIAEIYEVSNNEIGYIMVVPVKDSVLTKYRSELAFPFKGVVYSTFNTRDNVSPTIDIYDYAIKIFTDELSKALHYTYSMTFFPIVKVAEYLAAYLLYTTGYLLIPRLYSGIEDEHIELIRAQEAPVDIEEVFDKVLSLCRKDILEEDKKADGQREDIPDTDPWA